MRHLTVVPMMPGDTYAAADEQIARFAEGASLEEIYAEQVRAGEPAGSATDG